MFVKICWVLLDILFSVFPMIFSPIRDNTNTIPLFILHFFSHLELWFEVEIQLYFLPLKSLLYQYTLVNKTLFPYESNCHVDDILKFYNYL